MSKNSTALSEFGPNVDFVFCMRGFVANLLLWGSLPFQGGTARACFRGEEAARSAPSSPYYDDPVEAFLYGDALSRGSLEAMGYARAGSHFNPRLFLARYTAQMGQERADGSAVTARSVGDTGPDPRLPPLPAPRSIAAYHRALSLGHVTNFRRKVAEVLSELSACSAGLDSGAAGTRSGDLGADFARQGGAVMRDRLLQAVREIDSFLGLLQRYLTSVAKARRAPDAGAAGARAPAGPPDLVTGATGPAGAAAAAGPAAAAPAVHGDVELANVSDIAPDRPAASMVPDAELERQAGHIVHVDCGHNGGLSKSEMVHLFLHLRDILSEAGCYGEETFS